MFESTYESARHSVENVPMTASPEHEFSLDEALSEAQDIITKEIAQNEHDVNLAITKLTKLSEKSSLALSLELGQLEEKRQNIRFDQHLNLITLFNTMSFGPGIETGYDSLSGGSKELYHTFIKSLPRSATDGTREAVLEITTSLNNFQKSLPEDLDTFLDTYYTPFKEATLELKKEAQAQEHEKENRKQMKAKLDNMTPKELEDRDNLLRYI